MAVSQFRKSFFKQTVFECRVCHRRTRDTGDNGAIELCPQCYIAASIENGLNDGHFGEKHSPAYKQADAEYNHLRQAAVDLGGIIHGFTKRGKS
jgi:hypothetical protein